MHYARRRLVRAAARRVSRGPAKLGRRGAAEIYAISRPERARGAAMSRSNSPGPQRDHGQLLDVPAVARRLHVSDKTVRRLIARGELHAHRIGRQLRISEEELRRFIDASP